MRTLDSIDRDRGGGDRGGDGCGNGCGGDCGCAGGGDYDW